MCVRMFIKLTDRATNSQKIILKNTVADTVRAVLDKRDRGGSGKAALGNKLRDERPKIKNTQLKERKKKREKSLN